MLDEWRHQPGRLSYSRMLGEQYTGHVIARLHVHDHQSDAAANLQLIDDHVARPGRSIEVGPSVALDNDRLSGHSALLLSKMAGTPAAAYRPCRAALIGGPRTPSTNTIARAISQRKRGAGTPLRGAHRRPAAVTRFAIE